MSKKKLINIIILVVIAALLVSMISWKLGQNKKIITEKAKISQVVNEQLPVTSAVAKETVFNNSFATSGSFAPTQQVTAISDVAGKITQLNIKNGSTVSKGAVLMVLDNQLLQNQVKSIEINIAKAQKDLGRYTTLLATGGVTQQQIDELTSGISQYEVQMSSIKKQIADTYIRAPISGTITNKRVEQGMYVSPGMPIAEITNISGLKFQTYLTEGEVFKTKLGQEVRLSTNLYPGKDYFGKVSFIDVDANQTKTYLVEVAIPNSSTHPLKSGVNGTAYFENVGTVKSLAIPRSAIVGAFDDAKVYVVDNGIATLKEVKIGMTNSNRAQVLSGLNSGEVVVTSGQISIKDGDKVVATSNDK